MEKKEPFLKYDQTSKERISISDPGWKRQRIRGRISILQICVMVHLQASNILILSETKEISVTIKGRAEGTLYVVPGENGEAIATISISPYKNSEELLLCYSCFWK